jgi:hypothetical protein
MEVHHKHGSIKNWREFAKEVGIIVLGVVIALGGEQAVEAIHHQSEVQELRQALNEELSFDMGELQYEVQLTPCINARLAELDRWRESWKAGHPLKLTHELSVPPSRNFRTNTWRTAAGTAVALMPLKERMAYSQFYDSVEAVTEFKNASWEAWIDLYRYWDATNLSDEQLAQMRVDLGKASTLWVAGGPDYNVWVSEFAPKVGASPTPLVLNDPASVAGRKAFCTQLLAK